MSKESPQVTIGKEITITTHRQLGASMVDVEDQAWEIEEAKCFVVGKNPPKSEPEGWVLYHIKTGHAVFVSFPTKEAAGELAVFLEALPGRWDVKHPRAWLFKAGQALADKMIVEKKGERLTF